MPTRSFAYIISYKYPQLLSSDAISKYINRMFYFWTCEFRRPLRDIICGTCLNLLLKDNILLVYKHGVQNLLYHKSSKYHSRFNKPTQQNTMNSLVTCLKLIICFIYLLNVNIFILQSIVVLCVAVAVANAAPGLIAPLATGLIGPAGKYIYIQYLHID